MSPEQAQLDEILSEVRRLSHQVDYLATRQRRQEELLDEMVPIARQAMEVATEHLQAWEENGYIAFVRELLGTPKEVLENFTVEDARLLRESMVNILKVTRSMTRPKMLVLLNNVAHVVDQPAEDVSVFGLLKASHDADTRRGVATALALLRELGRGVSTLTERRQIGSDKLARHLASTGVAGQRKPAPAAQTPKVSPQHKPVGVVIPKATGASPVSLPGWELDAEGFLVDSDAWTEDFARQMSSALGLGELTEAHWQVIRFARAEYQRSGKSPNIRMLSTGSGVSTKEIYELFKKAPGMAAARLAGVPKPVGCI